jgi:hypothetical protein
VPEICFPEPAAPDDSLATTGEGIVAWLARSTHERAREARTFLNTNLSRLDQELAEQICHDLKHKWESAFFELIVARTLQELGGEIAYEVPIGSTGRRPDFLVSFPDTDIIVEAASPLFDQEVREELKSHAALSRIVESLVPEGVSVWLRSLPEIGPAESKKGFKEAVRSLLQPPYDWDPEAPYLSREQELDGGPLRLVLHPRSPGGPKISASPSYGGFSDCIERIHHAIDKKKDQLRGVEQPVILAINTSGSMTCSIEDIDIALLGRGCLFTDTDARPLYQRFICDGRLSRSKNDTPAIAGILGFLEAGFRSERDPILWLHPRFHGRLPAALMQLEVRHLAVTPIPAKRAGLMRSLRAHLRDEEKQGSTRGGI